jgi:hypothetical protein
MEQGQRSTGARFGRRTLLRGAAAGIAASAVAREGFAQDAAVKNGRINQSIAFWCFEQYWNIEQQCAVAKQLGCKSIELVQPKISRRSRNTASSARLPTAIGSTRA